MQSFNQFWSSRHAHGCLLSSGHPSLHGPCWNHLRPAPLLPASILSPRVYAVIVGPDGRVFKRLVKLCHPQLHSLQYLSGIKPEFSWRPLGTYTSDPHELSWLTYYYLPPTHTHSLHFRHTGLYDLQQTEHCSPSPLSSSVFSLKLASRVAPGLLFLISFRCWLKQTSL